MNPSAPAPNLELRDIHLPDGITWWPPAPGWWLLLFSMVLLILLTVYIIRRIKARRLHKAALQEFKTIQQAYAQHADDQQLVTALSIWLRRVCLSFYPRVEVASLTGPAWLVFLDTGLAKTNQPARFSEGPGQVLISAPYQAVVQVDTDALLSLCQRWLKTLPRYPQTGVSQHD